MDVLKDCVKENQRKYVRKCSSIEIAHQVRGQYEPKLLGTVPYRLFVPGRNILSSIKKGCMLQKSSQGQ